MRTLLFAQGALSLVGCKELGIRPVGPLAKSLPSMEKSEPLPPSATTAAAKPPPIQPTPPTMIVTPGEVTADNAHSLAQKLSAELTADGKSVSNVPVTAEISHVGRVKP